MNYMYSKLAADIVAIAQRSTKETYLKQGKVQVDAKSILGVMSLITTDNIDVITDDLYVKEAIYVAIG